MNFLPLLRHFCDLRCIPTRIYTVLRNGNSFEGINMFGVRKSPFLNSIYVPTYHAHMSLQQGFSCS